MRIISALFLRAKAWQLFGIAVILVGFSSSMPAPEGSVRASVGRLAVPSLLSGLLAAFCLGWLWSVGALLNSIVLTRFRHNQKWFSSAAIVLVLVFVLIPWLPHLRGHLVILWVITVLVFASFICVQLELRSVAKALVTAETGTVPTYFEYMNIFFAIAFWPVGIWSLQPKINRWYEGNKNEFMPRKTGPA
jgi:hypothetical protein